MWIVNHDATTRWNGSYLSHIQTIWWCPVAEHPRELAKYYKWKASLDSVADLSDNKNYPFLLNKSHKERMAFITVVHGQPWVISKRRAGQPDASNPNKHSHALSVVNNPWTSSTTSSVPYDPLLHWLRRFRFIPLSLHCCLTTTSEPFHGDSLFPIRNFMLGTFVNFLRIHRCLTRFLSKSTICRWHPWLHVHDLCAWLETSMGIDHFH